MELVVVVLEVLELLEMVDLVVQADNILNLLVH